MHLGGAQQASAPLGDSPRQVADKNTTTIVPNQGEWRLDGLS
jgi:hypothetical protein